MTAIHPVNATVTRLSHDDLDALLVRFASGRHPRVHAALLELHERREAESASPASAEIDQLLVDLHRMIEGMAAHPAEIGAALLTLSALSEKLGRVTR